MNAPVTKLAFAVAVEVDLAGWAQEYGIDVDEAPQDLQTYIRDAIEHGSVSLQENVRTATVVAISDTTTKATR